MYRLFDPSRDVDGERRDETYVNGRQLRLWGDDDGGATVFGVIWREQQRPERHRWYLARQTCLSSESQRVHPLFTCNVGLSIFIINVVLITHLFSLVLNHNLHDSRCVESSLIAVSFATG